MGAEMTPYRNLGGNSNVLAYEANADSIHVLFKSGVYPGLAIVEKMKFLAAQGRGLNSYISSIVKKNYAQKW